MSQESNEILEIVKKMENKIEATTDYKELEKKLMDKIKKKMEREYNESTNVLPKIRWPPHGPLKKKKTIKHKKKSSKRSAEKSSKKYKGGYCYFNCKNPNKKKIKKKRSNITKKSKKRSKYSTHSKTSKKNKK